MKTSPVGRRALLGIATRAALITYRDAFRRGQLGTVHVDVVVEAYDLAADELRAAGLRERRRARFWALAWVVWTAGAIATSYALDWNPALTGWGGWVFVISAWLMIKLSEHYAAANAHRMSARLLERPLAAHTLQADGSPMPAGEPS